MTRRKGGGDGRCRSAVDGATERREIVALGLQTVELDSIVGSTDRAGGFDRRFRPTSGVPRERFERLAAAARRGETFPPVDLYRVGKLHFVRDGHHRVAVARAFDWQVIPAYVTEVRTAVAAAAISPSRTCRARAASGCSSSGCRWRSSYAMPSGSAAPTTTWRSPRAWSRGRFGS